MSGDRFTARFDGAEHWRTLSPEAQEDIGALALELAVTVNALDDAGADATSARPFERAYDVLLNRLLGAASFHGSAGDDGSYPVPSILGPVCRRCGCSEGDACPAGCEWVKPDLCSACAEPGEAP